MLPSYAVLIDGGFIRRKLGSADAPMTATTLEAFIARLGNETSLQSMRLHRVYFYDAAPLAEKVAKPLNGGSVGFAQTPAAVQSKKLHQELSRNHFMAMRMGELAFRGWKLDAQHLKQNVQNITISAADLKPDIHQKGVDMRIGLDIAALTLKHQVHVIVLVTGDSDFVPAMKFARKEGTQLFLAPLGHGIKESMYEHADLVLNVN